jgi:cytochrome c-type biogenesis protein
MLNDLFTWLSNQMNGVSWISFPVSFIWGILSIILSPCHLGSIPLISGYLSTQTELKTKNLFLLSSIFSLGIVSSVAIIGIITYTLGRLMGDLGQWGNIIVGSIFILSGLYLIGILPLPGLNVNIMEKKAKGMFSTFSLGFVFGLALGPCTFAFMAPVLAAVLNSSSFDSLFSFFLLLSFILGHISVIILAAVYSYKLQHFLIKKNIFPGINFLKKISGVLVILAGLYFFWLIY